MDTNLFNKKELFLMKCQDVEFSRVQKRKNSAKDKMKTFNNMHLMEGMSFTTSHGFPILQAYTGNTNFDIYPYAKRKKLDGHNQALHFFAYDSTFHNAVWNRLETTTYNLRHFDYLFTPDYSLYVDHNLTLQNIEFTYKTRFIGAYWQNCGFNVIPTVSWGNANSFSYALEGLPKHSVLAVCGVGCKHSTASLILWDYAIHRIEEELEPLTIFVYGEEMEVSGIHTPLKFIPDYISENFRK